MGNKCLHITQESCYYKHFHCLSILMETKTDMGSTM